ncbi:MAG TPA: response regulator [Bacteroidales bacterium]|nr:response regulator [Bacteroidales bacterium]HPS17325.1 response regulator [Bacteroidales bacterium]
MNELEILIIDDEVQIRKLLSITLHSNNYKVLEAANAKEGLALAASCSPDMILLDIGLPDESGHIVLKRLREWYNKPIIILSVQNCEDDIVKALDNGANDYLVKPFRTGELLARLRSAIRSTNIEESQPVFDLGDLYIDLSTHTVKKNKEVIKLTSTEYYLLALLVVNEGKVLTHQYILRQVWGVGYISQSQYLRVFIAQLRKKIENDPNRPEYILTESGVGYRFVAKE